MKALFWVDNIPAMEMFAPIMDALPDKWEVAFVNYGRAEYEGCKMLRKRNRESILDMICRESPDIMALTREEATPVEKMLTQIGKETGIPTLLVPHGMLMSNEVELWEIKDSKLFRLKHIIRLARQGYRQLRQGKVTIPHLVRQGLFRIRNDFRDKKTLSRYDNFSKVAVFGEAMKYILLRYGVAQDNIVITGNPKFDMTYREKQKTKTGDILLITNYLVEFGTWTEKQREKYVKDVLEVADIMEKRLLVKIHPVNERIKDYERMDCDIEIFQTQPLAEIISWCGIAITTMSTGGLEVMASGKPLVVYNPYNDITQYSEKSGAYVARNKVELLSVIEDIVNNGMNEEKEKLADEFVYQQAYLQDGKASERIAKLIEEMVE
ncbi:hypothetical protein LCGC14_1418970 [marine sediment metagenome]|uniref:UDP-N-acetylglucosamine 2-epimerase domain-containing protein n=1 Tax=marine sediment metagenome TaxID=412755 RepID=A0A0F9M7F8_9ZZZZ